MRSALWLLFTAALAGTVYLSSFTGLDDAADVVLRLGSAAALLLSGYGLWATRESRSA